MHADRQESIWLALTDYSRRVMGIVVPLDMEVLVF
jgi:hypothetical protein